MDDASILELFRKRDERAIAELKRKYERLCLHIAGNILSLREDSEECVNSAYLELWNSIPPDDPENLKTYLCRIVRNTALDRLKYNSAAKRSSLLTVSLDELSECIPDNKNFSDGVSVRRLSEDINRFLRTQDELHRKVFVRRYWYGESVQAIAEFYGIKEKTAATYLFRTRKKLKNFLQKEGYDYE